MFIPTSIDDYLDGFMQANPGTDAGAIREALDAAVRAKKNGATCYQCGQPIWAAGAAVAGNNACFTCITGEADNSEDFEIDSVCF